MELYGLAEMIRRNPESCKPLFVQATDESVDANYVFFPHEAKVFS